MHHDPASSSVRTAGRLTDVRFLDGGYCLQSEYMSGRPSFRVRRFYAMFLHFRHPVHGEAVIDTGYSPGYFAATRELPGYLYRWATPVPYRQMARADFFTRHRIDPKKVATVFLSHFHVDHVGGLCYFPHSTIVADLNAYNRLQALGAWQQLKAGFLPELLPADFAARAHPVDRSAFKTGGSLYADGDSLLTAFRIHDYWGDGSLVMVDLPGHADGHIGYLLNTEQGRVFYVVDAFWDIRVLRAGRQIPRLARHVQHSWADYMQTQQKLFAIDRANASAKIALPLLATHCPTTYAQRWSDAD